MTDIQCLNYLVARWIGESKEGAEELLKEAKAYYNATAPKAKPTHKDTSDDDVMEIYQAYPTRCPVSGRSLGKGAKDKAKIESLLATHTKEELLKDINDYLDDCRRTSSYMKNLSTFLNNLPFDEAPIVGVLIDQDY